MITREQLQQIRDAVCNHGFANGWSSDLEQASAILDAALAAPEQEPVAWMRKWAFCGEQPYKEKNASGRMAWNIKFKILPVTKGKHFNDDIPLYTAPVATPQQPVSMETVYDTIIEWSTAGKGSRRELARRMIALFAAPQREWQGIADTDFPSIRYGDRSYWAGAKWAENLLRTKNEEKNT